VGLFKDDNESKEDEAKKRALESLLLLLPGKS